MKYLLTLLLCFPLLLSAQCDVDRHNTSAETGWKSCQIAPNPNAIRSDGHWILYDFTWDYMLEKVHIWNHNHPETLDDGVQDLIIDISDDGVLWTEAANITLPQASGLARYEGDDILMPNQRARFMLLTVVSTYGGSCAAISEIRIDIADDIECQNYETLVGDLGNRKYYADEFINTNGLVNDHKIVHFQTGSEVQFFEGFEARTNAEFLVEIAPCQN